MFLFATSGVVRVALEQHMVVINKTVDDISGVAAVAGHTVWSTLNTVGQVELLVLEEQFSMRDELQKFFDELGILTNYSVCQYYKCMYYNYNFLLYIQEYISLFITNDYL